MVASCPFKVYIGSTGGSAVRAALLRLWPKRTHGGQLPFQGRKKLGSRRGWEGRVERRKRPPQLRGSVKYSSMIERRPNAAISSAKTESRRPSEFGKVPDVLIYPSKIVEVPFVMTVQSCETLPTELRDATRRAAHQVRGRQTQLGRPERGRGRHRSGRRRTERQEP